MKKNFLKTGLLALMLTGVLLLSGCGGDGAETEAAYYPEENGVAEETANGNQDLETIIVYSNAFSDGRGEWVQEHAREVGLDVQFVDAGGVAIANRLVAEQHAPLADVVFGLNQILWQEMLANDILIPFVPSWADEIPAGMNHADGYFHAVSLVGNVLTYDLAQVSADEAPTDWMDLWENEALHGRFGNINELTWSTTHMVLSGIFTRFLCDDGFLGVSQEGWDHIAAKYRYGGLIDTNGDVMGTFIDDTNDMVMGHMWHMGIPGREESFDMEVGIMVPDVGIPFSVESLAIVNGTDNEEAAQRFIEWFGSAEVMNAFAIEFDYLPANPNALDGLNEFTLRMAAMPNQDIDWATVAQYMPEWLERIYLNYMP